MLQQISHLRFQQQNVPFFLMSGHTLALTKRFFNWNQKEMRQMEQV